MEEIVKYLFEAGMLKRTARSGWWAEKIKNPETVAEHAWRTALVAFILAKMEKLDDATARKVCTAGVFHDMHETRLLDVNKITHRYITVTKKLEDQVGDEQTQGMPKELRASLLASLELTGKEMEILKDADYLECAFQAKEYFDIGHKGAESWIESIESRLKTASARKLLAKMKKTDSNSWWKGLKKIE